MQNESEIAQVSRAKSVHRCWVYFIQGEGGGLIKIGHANMPVARMREFRTGSPAKLNLIGKFPGGQRVEFMLHRRFKEHRVHGEWFRPCGELLALIGSASREQEEMIRRFARDEEDATAAEDARCLSRIAAEHGYSAVTLTDGTIRLLNEG